MTTWPYDQMSSRETAALDPDGDTGRQHLLNPTLFRMLGDVTGRDVLDAGGGQGYLTRLLARRGARVTLLEPSATLLAHSVALENDQRLGIAFLPLPLADLAARRCFDAVVANMVLLDIEDWRDAMDACIVAVRPGGAFVFSVEHPCWATTAGTTWRESRRVELTEYGLEYSTPRTYGQNYHRPISHYLNHAIQGGCTLVELAEPVMPRGTVAPDQDVVEHIPNYLIARFAVG